MSLRRVGASGSCSFAGQWSLLPASPAFAIWRLTALSESAVLTASVRPRYSGELSSPERTRQGRRRGETTFPRVRRSGPRSAAFQRPRSPARAAAGTWARASSLSCPPYLVGISCPVLSRGQDRGSFRGLCWSPWAPSGCRRKGESPVLLPSCLGFSVGVRNPGALGTGREHGLHGLLTRQAGGALNTGADDFALRPILLPQGAHGGLVTTHKSQLH